MFIVSTLYIVYFYYTSEIRENFLKISIMYPIKAPTEPLKKDAMYFTILVKGFMDIVMLLM
jgi:hypothetical protein